MKLNEIIKQIGLEKVSLKTNISEQNLVALEKQNFTKLNRVKALGFLDILEREYPEIEVEDIRKAVKEHFEEEITIDENRVILSREVPMKKSISLFKWFVIVALLATGWYLYSQGDLDGLLNNINNKEESFTDSKALENNISEEEAENVVVANSADETVEELVTIDTSLSNIESNTSIKMLEGNQSVFPVGELNQSMTADNSTLQLKTQEETSENNATGGVITTITINPTRGMLWYGFINLENKKRYEFMKNVSTPFDIKSGRWLLVTGHGYVDIVSDPKTVELTDNKKHHFYIDKSDIKEITKTEFREMNGNRGW